MKIRLLVCLLLARWEELSTTSFIRHNHPNLASRRRPYYKSLQDDSTMVLLMDKGRASVVLNTDTCRTTLGCQNWLRPDRSVWGPNKPPDPKAVHIKTKRANNIRAVYNKIRPGHKQPPKIYGLSKIHKADTPLRNVVSCINTVCVWFVFCNRTSWWSAQLTSYPA